MGRRGQLSLAFVPNDAVGETNWDFLITEYYGDKRRRVGMNDFEDGKRIMFVENVEVVRISSGAVLVRQKNQSGTAEFWCPKSQIDEDSEITEDSEPGDEGTLAIPKWLADKNDLSYVD